MSSLSSSIPEEVTVFGKPVKSDSVAGAVALVVATAGAFAGWRWLSSPGDEQRHKANSNSSGDEGASSSDDKETGDSAGEDPEGDGEQSNGSNSIVSKQLRDALFEAVEQHDASSVQSMIKQCPALLEVTNSKGMTALIEACDRGYAPVVKALLEAGADPNQADEMSSTTPFYAATRPSEHKSKPDMAVVALLAAHPRVHKSIFTASALGDVVATRDMIKRDPRCVNERDALGHTPLFLATLHGHELVAALLLNHGARANDQVKYRRKHVSPLDAAVNRSWSKSHRRIGRLLLDYGADASLHDACYVGSIAHVHRFLQVEPQTINDRDRAGNTPLTIAIEYCNQELVQLLLEEGAQDTEFGSGKWLAMATLCEDRNWNNTAFHDVNMNTCVFNDVDLSNGTLFNVNMERVVVHNVSLVGSTFHNVDFANVRLDNCKIDGLRINGKAVRLVDDDEEEGDVEMDKK